MAASVYATPPPDHLSGDETALSDVSNSSQLSSPSNSMKTLKRSLSATSLLSTTTATPTTNAIPFAGNINITLPTNIATTLDTLTANNGSDEINVNSLSSLLLDSMPDNSKKRRKQSTPIRISDAKAAIAASVSASVLEMANSANEMALNEIKEKKCEESTEKKIDKLPTPLPRIYLSNISQLQQKLLPSQSISAEFMKSETFDKSIRENMCSEQKENGKHDEIKKLSETNENLLKRFVNNLNCDQCGLKLESEIKLGLHILQEHGPKNFSIAESSAEDEIPKMYVKKEPNVVTSSSVGDWEQNDDKEKPQTASNGATTTGTASAIKPEDWLSMSSLPFPFSPEAAAMLSASGYLPQLPLLGVAGVSPFATSDGLSRSNAPPLRIFNPEAYCDLCNKEFCNKYFLKTHKANKHNIYEPAVSVTDIPSTSQLNHMSQVFQLHQQQQQQQLAHQQMQQNQQQQQLISPSSPPQVGQISQQGPNTPQQSNAQSPSNSTPSTLSQEMSVFCDICFKRFTNVFAMRRHRTKVHEIPPPSDGQTDNKNSASASNTSTPLTVPDGFREDFSIEQEDTTFTPQPRKLSPLSIQQARDANFSVEKLKRLGVINPEAFCELCCKEYCNKYFLRTHKIKRHGIFMPVDDTISKDDRSMANAAAAAATAWQFMQNAPLNLMIGNSDQINHFQNQRKKLEAGEIRKLSFDSNDGEFEEHAKKRKIDDDKKPQEISDDNEEGDNKSSEEVVNNQQDGDAISVDLQKLQSMIMQLNDLNAQRPVSCSICGKEQENQFVLHSHMITEHANIGENNNGHKISPSVSPINCQSIETCKHCDKELPNTFALTQHMYEVHGIQPSSPIREGFVTPERPISGISCLPPVPNAQLGDRRPYTITPTSSYCEICNKELCNKYFMKTHMQRMHGIEIENGAQIGGVVCNICNKELCSKYFLRVHKHNTHGIIEEGSPLPQPRQNGDQIENDSMFPLDPSLRPGEISELSNRYLMHYTEVCPLCSRRFRGSKWLRTHLLADHGKSGTEKLREIEQMVNIPKSSSSPTLKIPNGAFGLNPSDANFIQKHSLNNLFSGEESANPSSASKSKEYQCKYCSFSTPSYAFLFIHERSHTLLAGTNINSILDDGTPIKNDFDDITKIHSETAVSLAKDQTMVNHQSETPTSTPATTPVPVPLTSQETAAGSKPSTTITEEKLNDRYPLKSQAIQQQQQQQQQQHLQQQHLHQQQQDAQHILMDMANLTQRPTTYAIPQEINNELLMQSFLIEPLIENGNESTVDDDENKLKTRFVPSVVFLPVKKRVTGKTVVSFTLTPA